MRPVPVPEYEHATAAVRLLLIEDDPDFAALVRRCVAGVSGRPAMQAAHTLAEALEALRSGSFDLVLADLGLPDSSGIDTLQRITSATTCPIIVLTANDDPGLRDVALGVGAYEFLHKMDFDAQVLARLVRLGAIQARTFASLRESEARFRSLTQLSSDWYWEQDSELRLTFMSSRLGPRTGLAPAAYLGRKRWEQPAVNLTEADWARHRAQLERHEPFRDFEMERRTEDGSSVWLSISGEPVYDAAGRFAGYRGVGRDITAQKRAEQLQRLEHSATRCLAEAETAAAGASAVLGAICETLGWECGRYFEADEQAGVLRFAAAWGRAERAVQDFIEASRALTYRRGEGLSGHVWQTGAPLWVSDVSSDRRASGSSRRVNGRAALQGGSFVFPVIARGRTLGIASFSSGDPKAPNERLLEALGVIGSQLGQFLRRKHAETALRESMLVLERTFQHMDQGIGIFNPDLRLVAMNRRARELLAVPDAMLRLRCTLAELIRFNAQRGDYGKIEVEKFVASRVAVARSGQPDLFYRRLEDGTYLEIRGTPMPDGGLICVYTDVTARTTEEARKSAHLRYQQRVAAFGQSALSCRDPQELAQDAVRQALAALDVDAVAYVERPHEPGHLAVRALAGADAGAARSVKSERDPISAVLDSAARFTAESCELPFDWGRGGAAAIVPVPGDCGVRGAVCAVSRGSKFGEDQLNFLDAVAAVLSAGLKRVASEERLAFLARFDLLTGLPNRGLLTERFAQMIEQTRRRGLILGVLFVDLDDFKGINDTLGHAAGDELLRQAALRLQEAVRPGDTVARISGDEFALVLADLAHQEDAALVAQKIVDRLAAPFQLEAHEVLVTASVGIASYPADGSDAETLLGAADAAMYRAKQSGRNGYQFFTHDIDQRTKARALLGVELRRALEREEFVLAYQPKYDLLTMRPCGAEALLRWNHPERGFVTPGNFVPVLEETGLIVPVGEWVLRRACEDVKACAAAGVVPLPVAVNLSARQFRSHDLGTRIRALVEAAGVSPELIELEITESHLMHDPDHAIRVMRGLREDGIRIAIDDFGTGYSSLAYLTRFPVASLKIDGSFVAGIGRETTDPTIVRTIIEMARTLDFTVIGEGVETLAQVEFLRRFGCHQAQGYFFARPMPIADFIALIASGRAAPPRKTANG
jgi:diguanylate cyclase (GGDEF)-like protein/PAS domain S-box-containing protein